MTQQASNSTSRTAIRPLQAFQQAVSFHEHGRLWEAAQLFNIVLQADDRHFGAVYRLGLVRLQQGRFDDAAHLFRRAARIDRNSADAHHHLGAALAGLGRFADAIPCYERALTAKPNFPEAHNNLGYVLERLGRTEDAISHYERALAIVPDYAEARTNLGNALQMQGRSAQAILQHEKALAIRPNYAEAHNNLGNVLATLGRHVEAIAHYEKAISIRPKYAEARHSLGNAFAALGRHSEAIVQYDNAIATRPDYVDAHLELGNVLGALGRHEEAIAWYDQALAIRSDHVEALSARGYALVRVGNDAEAGKIFEGLIKRGVHSLHHLLALTSAPALVISIDLLAKLNQVARQETDDEAEFENLAAFVRAAALDKMGRHEEAWKHLVLANRTLFLANHEEYGDVAVRERANLALLRENPTEAAGGGQQAGQTISLFILGPSRSGKTTMERLVSTLDGVKRGYEDSAVDNALRRTFQRAAIPCRSLFENLPPTLYPLCRDIYFDELAHRSGSARVFTNTHPARIHDARLIAAAFPNVRFILMKRNVKDNALRIFQRRYNRGHIYSYDLKASRDYIVWYHQMMDLLAEKLPDIVRVLNYEDMVVDPAGALRVAAELCGLKMSHGPLPTVGDDRECATPYRQFMAAELEA